MQDKNHFIIVGAQRSGSTLLSSILEKHTEICMASPRKPEPKYFLKNDITYKDYINSYFKHLKEEKILGEKSTSYYENQSAVINIKKYIPNCKIIFILRDPVFRAISNYYFTCKFGLEPRSLYDTFMAKKIAPIKPKNISVNPFNYLERGNYYSYIKYYENIFGKENINILILEKLLKQKSELKRLLQFLNISEDCCATLYSMIQKDKINIYPSVNMEIKTYLSNHFKSMNRLLSENYKIDIKLWT